MAAASLRGGVYWHGSSLSTVYCHVIGEVESETASIFCYTFNNLSHFIDLWEQRLNEIKFISTRWHVLLYAHEDLTLLRSKKNIRRGPSLLARSA